MNRDGKIELEKIRVNYFLRACHNNVERPVGE